MKKIILNFESKQNNFKELVQEAFNKDILNYLVSKNTYTEFKKQYALDSACETYENSVILGGLSKSFALPGLRPEGEILNI